MGRKPAQVRDAELAGALRAALEKGAFAPADASRVIRALDGHSQEEFAVRLGVSVKVIKALESGKGNPRFASLEKIASAVGLRVAFVRPAAMVELLDPDARAADELRQRQADVKALKSGKISERVLHERNALEVGGVAFELPSLA